MNFSTTLPAIILIVIAHPTAAAQQSRPPYFEARQSSDVHALLERNGYRVEQDGILWLIAPDNTRVQLNTFGNQAGISGLRVSAWFSIGQSSAAIEQALYYERTNPLASVAFYFTDEFRTVQLQRDIEFGPGRTEANILANVRLLFGLIPHFEASLAESDPELAAFWYGAEENDQ